jgi:glycerophosphoryl diester phosphodiesterase
MERLLAFNVDGMITDRPDVLRALLEQRGMPVPPRVPREH